MLKTQFRKHGLCSSHDLSERERDMEKLGLHVGWSSKKVNGRGKLFTKKSNNVSEKSFSLVWGNLQDFPKPNLKSFRKVILGITF